MKIRLAIPDKDLNAHVVEAALEAVTRADEALIRSGRAPLWRDALKAGVKWQPEPKGQGMEHFDLADVVSKRGWGDCDDVAPYEAASLRVTGEDPAAYATVVRSGPGMWHAKVVRGDGRFSDPSKQAGMGKWASVDGYHGTHPVQRPMHARGHIALATIPLHGGVAARVDLPWQGSDAVVSGHAYAATSPAEALCGALLSAIYTGENSGAVAPAHLASAIALRESLKGGSAADIRDCLARCGLDPYGGDHAVGSLWGKIKHSAKALSHPLAHLVSPKSLLTLVSSPLHLVKAEAHAALELSKALAQGRPGAAIAALKKGAGELAANPAFSTLSKGAALFPGGGAISAGLATAAALGRGLSFHDAALAAVRAALPPGASSAFDMAYGLAHGQSLSSAALAAARQQLPAAARTAYDAGLAAAAGHAHRGGSKHHHRASALAHLPPAVAEAFDHAASLPSSPLRLPQAVVGAPLLVRL